MRRLLFTLLASLACLGLFSLHHSLAASTADPSKPNFNGVWMLDRKSSTSLDPLMRNIGTGFLERKYANSATLRATFRQTDQVLTVATRGFGFGLDEKLDLDGLTRPSNQELLGATSINVKTAWTNNRELVETREIKTKYGKNGQLIITRNLINEGKTMVVTFTLKLDSQPETISVRQLWNKQP